MHTCFLGRRWTRSQEYREVPREKGRGHSITPATDKRTWESLCVSTTFSCNTVLASEYERRRRDSLDLARRVGDKHFEAILSFELADEPGVPESCELRVWICCNEIAAHHSSLAIPKSLQQRMRALLLHASVAVAIPLGSKKSCSPRAIATSLWKASGYCK